MPAPRLHCWLTADFTELDSLSDGQEFAWNQSDPFDPDPDNDGIVDMLEDFDSDTLANSVELGVTTSPIASQSCFGHFGHFGNPGSIVGGFVFYSVPIVFDYINQQMAALGGGYQLTPIQF